MSWRNSALTVALRLPSPTATSSELTIVALRLPGRLTRVRVTRRRTAEFLNKREFREMAATSLFTMLITKQPGNFAEQIVYEDDKVVAFLDKFPSVAGHTLVVPREQVEKLHELSPETAAALGAAVAKVAAKVVKATGTDQYNVLVNNGKDSGQEIPHVHFHIIPRTAGDYTQSWAKSIENTRSESNVKPSKLPDEGAFTGELKDIRDKIRA